MLPVMTAVNLTKFITLLLGSWVKFSFTTFFATQPMPAAMLVRVAASMIVCTSLLLEDMVYRKIYSFNSRLFSCLSSREYSLLISSSFSKTFLMRRPAEYEAKKNFLKDLPNQMN